MSNSTKQLKDKFNDLEELKIMIESQTFQENIIKPLRKEQFKLKKVSQYKGWEEVLKAQGKEEGLAFLEKLFQANELQRKNIQFDLKSDAE